jgi:hypothetical protein
MQLFPIILFNLVVAMLLSLVGGPRSGKGMVHRITYNFCYFFLLVALFTKFILDKLNTGLLNQIKQTKSYFIDLSPLLTLPHSHLSRTQLTPSMDY